jgi:signal transduction histidine kinase
MKTLRVLLADTRADDAAVLDHELRGAYRPAIKRVEDALSFTEALREQSWDVVISDHAMADFGAMDALKLLRKVDPKVPFIVLSGMEGEDLAGGSPRRSARAPAVKRNLLRLVPTLKRELRRPAAQRALRAEKQLRAPQALLDAMIRYFPGVVLQLVSRAPGTYAFALASDGSYELLELSPEELRKDAQAFFRLLDPSDTAAFAAQMKKSAEALRPVNWEGRLRTARTGTTKWVNVRLTPACDSTGEVVWEGFMANVTRNKMHEQEIVRSRRRLSELTSHLEKAKERERERIARELHDDIGGNLSAMKISLARLAGRLRKDDAKTRDAIAALDTLVDETAAAIMRIGQDLRPGILDLGLEAAIEWQALEFTSRIGIPCALDLSPSALDLGKDVQTALFSIFREMLTNVAKHAHATQVQIRLRSGIDGVELAVTDNGIGMTPADRLKADSFGLRGMEERATQLGGSLVVEPATPTGGTRISVQVPRAQATRTGARGLRGNRRSE